MEESRTGPSLAWRLAAAVALTIGFYTLAILIAAALLAAAILPWVLRGSNNLWVTVTCFVLGITILVAIFPRRNRFQPHGVRVTKDDQPRLLGMIEEEARTTGARAPDEVYTTLEVNASVTEVRGRRIMMIGVPLLHITSERGMRGIIAHEFGHYAGGDTRLGPWVWRTYDGVARTIDYLTDEDDDDGWTQRAVRQPFIWYGNAFMRITAAIKRRQEFAADQLAARSAGRDAYAAALRRIHAYGPSFDAYWENEVAAVLRAGKRPPVVHGFGQYLRTDTIDKAASEFLDQQMKEKTDRYDSHPSLSERLDALQACEPGEPDGSPGALELLREPEALEREMLAALVHPDAAELPALKWEDVADEVYLARARAMRAEYGDVLGAATVADLSGLAQDIGRLGEVLQRREPELPDEAAPTFAATLLAEALLAALADDGWAVEAGLAEPVHACRGDEKIAPYDVVAELHDSGPAAAAWRERATERGIADLPLASAATAKAEAA
jgi:Zn-dependent protease with chaperone function